MRLDMGMREVLAAAKACRGAVDNRSHRFSNSAPGARWGSVRVVQLLSLQGGVQ